MTNQTIKPPYTHTARIETAKADLVAIRNAAKVSTGYQITDRSGAKRHLSEQGYEAALASANLELDRAESNLKSYIERAEHLQATEGAKVQARQEKGEAELKARLRDAFMRSPAATDADFEAAYPQLRDTQLQKESVSNDVDVLVAEARQRTGLRF